MSYRCGIGKGMEVFGMEPGPPRIMCDACGKVLRIKGLPPKWLMSRRAPPKWTCDAKDDGTRRDWCPDCTLEKLTIERDAARANARILAHAYTTDSRPPQRAVTGSLAYPAIPAWRNYGNYGLNDEDHEGDSTPL